MSKHRDAIRAARYASARVELNDEKARAIFKNGQEAARKKVKHRRSKETPTSGYIKTVHAGAIPWSALPSQMETMRHQMRELASLNGSRNFIIDGKLVKVKAVAINKVEFPRP